MTIETIGIVGTGELAAAIAGRIAAHGKVRVRIHGFDAAPRTSRIDRAANLFDLASECQAIVAVFETHEALRLALTGDEDRPGMLGAMAPGTLLADFSGGTPDDVRRLAGALSGHAIGLIDGAVVGSIDAVRDGAGHVLLGGFGAHIDSLWGPLCALGVITRAGVQGHARLVAALVQTVHAGRRALQAEVDGIAARNALPEGLLPGALATLPDTGDERLIPVALAAGEASGAAIPLTLVLAAASGIAAAPASTGPRRRG